MPVCLLPTDGAVLKKTEPCKLLLFVYHNKNILNFQNCMFGVQS